MTIVAKVHKSLVQFKNAVMQLIIPVIKMLERYRLSYVGITI